MPLDKLRIAAWCRNRRWFPLLTCALIMLLDPVVGNTYSDLDFPIEYEMALEPFQVLLQYDDTFPMATSDEMVVLSSTQFYLSSQMEETEPDFTRLILYQYVRDYVMESREHFAKIAINGVIFFSSHITPDLRSRVIGRVFKSLSADSDLYVDVLHIKGMNHVVNSTLLSIQGNAIVYQDGELVEMTKSEPIEEEDTQAISRDMGHDMRKKVMFLCLLVPAIVIIVAAAVFALRMAREINWKGSGAQNDKLWRRRNKHPGNVADSRQQRKNHDSETGYSRDDLSDISSDTRSLDT